MQPKFRLFSEILDGRRVRRKANEVRMRMFLDERTIKRTLLLSHGRGDSSQTTIRDSVLKLAFEEHIGNFEASVDFKAGILCVKAKLAAIRGEKR